MNDFWNDDAVPMKSEISKIHLKDKQNTFLLIQPEIKMSYGTDFFKVFV